MLDEMLADSPIHLWKFDEASGSFVDSIGVLHLISLSSITYAQDGPGLYSAIGTGAGSKARTNNTNVSPDPTDVTYEIWLYQTNVTTSSTPQTPWSSFANTGDNGGHFWIDNYGHSTNGVNGSFRLGMIQGATGNARIQCAIDQLLVVNEWTHCAWTFKESTGTLKAYRNGVLDNTTVGTSGARADTPGPVRFGSFSDSYSQPFQGRIGPAAIYATDLSADRLLAHYDSLEPPDPYMGIHTMVLG